MPDTPETPTPPAPQTVPDTPPTPPVDEPLGDGGKAALDAERKARKEAEKARGELEKQLQAIADKDKTELERAQARVAELEKTAAEERTQRLRLTAASKHSIPGDYLDLLTATDEDALEAQAVKVAQLVAAKAPTPPPPFTPNPGQAAGNSTPSTTATVAAGAELYRQRKASKTTL